MYRTTITKSRSGHYTVTVREMRATGPSSEIAFREVKLSSLAAARHLAAQFIAGA